MQCPLLAAFFARLLEDLNKGSIYQDLLDEAHLLSTTPHAPALDARFTFCCAVVMDRVLAYVTLSPARALPPFPIAGRPMSPALIEKSIALVEQAGTHYNIAVAEYQMGNEQHNATQLAHVGNQRHRRQVLDGHRVLTNTLARDAWQVGDAFYSFMYRDLADAEELVKWAKTLAEMSNHVE